MLEHIVLFKWKPEATPDAIASILDDFNHMPGNIPEVVSVSCGENFTNRSQGFTHGLVVRLNVPEELERYQQHPFHQKIVQEKIKPILADILAVDYQF
ncbi:Dabb family protein [Spirulina subsalsa FACHB-351]|uniref:Dabb family protein n=1 Tax=Spirulina subsalsa FACHB-351 TaxID=234711 RepID=A0ABT3L4P2_9CYAN|nr:Dabb family protein [Spirulina subsalsa]MCW6036456.1 Dabb family protein [Spirulina subsalsa FACHB-351]